MDLEVVAPSSRHIALSEALAAARTYAERSLTESTRRGYARDLSAFRTWCQARGVAALPAEPQTLAAYLADLALTDRPATIGRKLAAIAAAHRDAGLESPTEHGMVKRTFAGIRREKGTAQKQKAALLVDDLRKMLRRWAPRYSIAATGRSYSWASRRHCGAANSWRCASRMSGSKKKGWC